MSIYQEGGKCVTYGVVWQTHEFGYQFLLLGFVRLSRNHVTDGLVERMHLHQRMFNIYVKMDEGRVTC